MVATIALPIEDATAVPAAQAVDVLLARIAHQIKALLRHFFSSLSFT